MEKESILAKGKNKDLEELIYINDLNCLFPALLLPRRDALTFSLWVLMSALLLSSNQTISLCVLPLVVVLCLQ